MLGSTKSKINKDKYNENVPHLEITMFVLINCNIVNNDYQQDSRILYSFFPNKAFGQLLDNSPKNVIFLKTFDSKFSYLQVWSTNQNSKPLKIRNTVNITLAFN